MTNLITPEELLADLRLVAEKKMADNGGVDWVYVRPGGESSSCQYVHVSDDEEEQWVGGCIFGTYLHDAHEIPFERIHGFEGEGAAAVLACFELADPKYLRDGNGFSITQKVANAVQGNQDNGMGWLAAVEDVEARYNLGDFK